MNTDKIAIKSGTFRVRRFVFYYLYPYQIPIHPVAKKSLKQEEHSPASDIPVLLKIDSYFIAKKNIQSVVRFGKGCKIILITGDELLIRVNYSKVVEIVG